MSSMNRAFSDSWPGALGWERNCTLFPWVWKGARCRFFSPASRSICPTQVGQRHLNHDKHRPQNSWKIQIVSAKKTKKVWFCCSSNIPDNAISLRRKTQSSILRVKVSEVSLKTTFLSTVFKTLCELIKFKVSLDLLWTSKKKLHLFLSTFHI